MIKQAIILRKDLKMPKGKLCSQAAHASLDAYLEQADINIKQKWVEDGSPKIVLSADSMKEFTDIRRNVQASGLPFSFIVDAGKTTFGGKETPTAIGIGPAKAEQIDKLTRNLKLL